MQSTSKAEIALNAIRKAICLSGSEDENLLHETELAQRFGMSRTPIRQVLQRLAYERMVQTRTGVGTVATPLRPAERERDLITYGGILAAIRMHDMPPLTVPQHADIQVLRSFAEALSPQDPEMQYELLSRTHGVLRALVDDPVLADAFSAAFWRSVRWHMRDLAADPEGATARLRARIEHGTGYADRAPADLFARFAAEAEAWAQGSRIASSP